MASHKRTREPFSRTLLRSGDFLFLVNLSVNPAPEWLPPWARGAVPHSLGMIEFVSRAEAIPYSLWLADSGS